MKKGAAAIVFIATAPFVVMPKWQYLYALLGFILTPPKDL